MGNTHGGIEMTDKVRILHLQKELAHQKELTEHFRTMEKLMAQSATAASKEARYWFRQYQEARRNRGMTNSELNTMLIDMEACNAS